jgi:hypothetical protein
VWRARASEIETIAADVASLEPRLRRVSAAVTALISGTAGNEDRAMNDHLAATAAQSREAERLLRQAAAALRTLDQRVPEQRGSDQRAPGQSA